MDRREKLNEILDSDEYHVESAKLEFALELKRVLDRESITHAVFAERLGVSRPMISKLLRGDANMTIETMVKACRRLHSNLYLKVMREDCSARFFELAPSVEKSRHHEQHSIRGKWRSVSENSGWVFSANDLDIEVDVDTNGQAYEAKSIAA
ncbi:helix-turn-helix domain-containing protein [Lysobacter gummosus]|uniref:helix-turn-helix domain-containing protein n=1 Tax=Lysobacter gummosus TaxID=262324 RepID=UPI003640740C